MHILVFRHVPFEGLGLIEPALLANGFSYEYVDLHAGAPVPDAGSAAGLIFMGGPMSVNDDSAWLREEERIVVAAAERGTPVLGICLGAQLIARALGGRVYRNHCKEIGWFEIELTPEAFEDALLGVLAERETVFHWHGETFDIPPGGVRLAASEVCRNQAFRIRDNIYGLQFHLEVTPEMIADWCAQDANCGDVRELASPIDARYNAGRLAALAPIVFGRWLELARNALKK